MTPWAPMATPMESMPFGYATFTWSISFSLSTDGGTPSRLACYWGH